MIGTECTPVSWPYSSFTEDEIGSEGSSNLAEISRC